MNKQKQIDLSLVEKYNNTLSILYYDSNHSIHRDILAGVMNVTLDVQKKILTYINESIDYNYIVSTCKGIYICSSKKDKLTACFNEIKSGLTRLNKGKTMLKKLGLDGQYNINIITNEIECYELVKSYPDSEVKI